MKYLICYDISEDKIRDRVVQYLEEFAYRLQFSVFTCRVNAAEGKKIWQKLCKLVAKAENPMLLMVPLCQSCQKNIRQLGKPLEEDEDYFVI